MHKGEIIIDGEAWVCKDTQAQNEDGLPFVIVRSKDSGVHAGYEVSRDGDAITLTRAIRIWYWDGAATLSQLAKEGTSKPEKCKFGVPIDLTVFGCCERITATEASRNSIEGVQSWRK